MNSQERIFNRTFSLGEDGFTHLNACVGNNGFVDKLTYANGYGKAARLLIDAVIADDVSIFVDDIVYPICFNARHHIELFLKWAVPNVEVIRDIPSEIHLSTTHDLDKLFGELDRLCTKTDFRLGFITSRMIEFIKDFCEIDPTGQTFRYPNNKENVRHLEKTPIINILVFRDRYLELTNLIEEFVEATYVLKGEYRTGTFTSKLSRLQIAEIASLLPPHSDWILPEFDLIRLKLRQQFSLTGNDLSRAISKIKGHREFSSLIGVELQLPHISENTFLKLQKVIDQELEVDCISVQEWTTIFCVYEVSSYQYYSESFDFLYLTFIRDFEDQSEVYEFLSKLIRNNDRLALGLRKLGQTKLLNSLTQLVNFESAVFRLKEENRLFFERMKIRDSDLGEGKREHT